MQFNGVINNSLLNHHARTIGSFADHEPGLWRAVITQALMDAASRSRKSEAQRYRSDALSWLLSDTDDFAAVCDNAGLDPDYVRSRAKTALARNCEWRLPAGMGWRTRGREVTGAIEVARVERRKSNIPAPVFSRASRAPSPYPSPPMGERECEDTAYLSLSLTEGEGGVRETRASANKNASTHPSNH